MRIRSGPERPLEHTVYTLSTQTNYRYLVDRLDAQGLPWGTLVIDTRWRLHGGLKDVDIGRWQASRRRRCASHLARILTKLEVTTRAGVARRLVLLTDSSVTGND